LSRLVTSSLSINLNVLGVCGVSGGGGLGCFLSPRFFAFISMLYWLRLRRMAISLFGVSGYSSFSCFVSSFFHRILCILFIL